jgi:hypothetical protein
MGRRLFYAMGKCGLPQNGLAGSAASHYSAPIMTAQELATSALSDAAPAATLSAEAQALWHAKKGNWHEAHEIAQDIHTPMGSWIHALLHLIEGDIGNAGYWYAKARKPVRRPAEIDAEWNAIAREVLGS